MMNITFDGKRALVTGAGQGLWSAKIYNPLSSEGGAETYALSKTQANLDKLKAEVPSIHTICVDLMDWEKSRSEVEKVVKDFGPIHLLVNNAGINIMERFISCSPDAFDKTMNVNVRGAINVSQVVAKSLLDTKTPGAIVNVSSKVSKCAYDSMAIYSSTKAALDQLTRVMALELGPHNIRINAVNPTGVLTAMTQEFFKNPALVDKVASKIPLGRIACKPNVQDYKAGNHQ